MWYMVRLWRLREQPGPEWPFPSAWDPPSSSPVRWDPHLPLSEYRAALVNGELGKALGTPPSSPHETRQLAEVWLWTGSAWVREGWRVRAVRHPTNAQEWTFTWPAPQGYYRTGRQPPQARRWTTTPTLDGPHEPVAFWLEPA